MTASAQLARFGLNVLSTIILARLLAPGEFGLVGMATAVTGLAVVFKDLGLVQATVQKADITEAQISTLFWINAAFSVLVALCFSAVAPVVASFYGEPRLVWIIVAISGTLVVSGLAVQHQALLQRQMHFGRLALIEVVSAVMGLAIAMVAAGWGLGYWALVLMLGVTATSSTVGTWLVCRWLPSAPRFGNGVRDLLQFGKYLTGFNLLNYFARNADDVLIGRFWGASQLGLYSRAYQLLLLPIQLAAAPVGTVAVSALSRLTGDPARYRHAYIRMIEPIATITMPAVMWMILTSDWIFVSALGEQWVDASPIFSWLGIAAFTQPIGHSMGWLFVSQGRAKEMWQWGLISSGIIVASIIVGLPWGPVGVAAVYSLVGVALRTPLIFWFVGRSGPVRIADLYRVPLLGVHSAAWTGAAVLVFRYWAGELAPMIGLVISAGIAALTAVCALMCLPRGRSVMRDVVSTIRLMIDSRSRDPIDEGRGTARWLHSYGNNT